MTKRTLLLVMFWKNAPFKGPSRPSSAKFATRLSARANDEIKGLVGDFSVVANAKLVDKAFGDVVLSCTFLWMVGSMNFTSLQLNRCPFRWSHGRTFRAADGVLSLMNGKSPPFKICDLSGPSSSHQMKCARAFAFLELIFFTARNGGMSIARKKHICRFIVFSIHVSSSSPTGSMVNPPDLVLMPYRTGWFITAVPPSLRQEG